MYTLISYDETFNADGGGGVTATTASTMTGEHYPIKTHATGCYKSVTNTNKGGVGHQDAECGPLLTLDPLVRCLAIHSSVGYVTIIPINKGYSSVNDWKRVPWRRNAVNVAEGGGAGATGSGTSATTATKPLYHTSHTHHQKTTRLC